MTTTHNYVYENKNNQPGYLTFKNIIYYINFKYSKKKKNNCAKN